MKNRLFFSLLIAFSIQQGFCLDNYNGVMKLAVDDMQLENLNISVDGPSAIVIIGNFAYVSNYISGTLLKINLNDKTTTEFTNENMNKPVSMVTNDDGSYIYIADAEYGLFIFNTTTEVFKKLEVGGGINWLVFSGDNTLWSVTYSRELIKINVSTDDPQIELSKFTPSCSRGLHCIAYDNRGDNENIIIGSSGCSLIVYDTLSNEFSTFKVAQEVLSLCVVDSKLYFTGFNKDGSSILGWVDNEYKSQFEIKLGASMKYMVIDPNNNTLFLSDIGVAGGGVLPSGCREIQVPPYVVKGGLGTSVYKWNTTTDQLISQNDECNAPWAMAIKGQDLYVLDLPPPEFAISCPAFIQLKRLPFRTFNGGFAR